MNSSSKIVFIVFNSLFLFWLAFALQRILEIGVDVSFLNAGVAVLSSAIFNYIIWNQHLNFNTIVKYAVIFWGIGFILGIIYISIYDPNDGQGIFLSILFTGPIGWLLGASISIFKAKMFVSSNNTNDSQHNL